MAIIGAKGVGGNSNAAIFANRQPFTAAGFAIWPAPQLRRYTQEFHATTS